MELRAELGATLTPADVVELLRLDVSTVKKYASRLGGVEVAPGTLRFFEGKLREVLCADTDAAARSNEMKRHGQVGRQDRVKQVVRERTRPGISTRYIHFDADFSCC